MKDYLGTLAFCVFGAIYMVITGFCMLILAVIVVLRGIFAFDFMIKLTGKGAKVLTMLQTLYYKITEPDKCPRQVAEEIVVRMFPCDECASVNTDEECFK